MNTLNQNKIRQIAKRMLEITIQFNNADHVDVKIFVDSADAERYRAELVELCSLSNELKSVECEVIERVQIAMEEYYSFMEKLQEDVACKIERRSRNTFCSEEENYQIAKWFNDGFAAKTGIRLY